MSETVDAIARLRKAALRTGGYSRSVLHEDLCAAVAHLDALERALRAVISVADRKTDIFDRAKAILQAAK